MKIRYGQGQMELVQGDISDEDVDAIVNAANPRLAGGGGVDGAIHRRAGPELLEACQQLACNAVGERCPTGQARSTRAFALSARWVIHAVGPVYRAEAHERCAEQLVAAYRASFALATQLECETIAVPAISAGVYGFPLEEAARIAIRETRESLRDNALPRVIRFVLFNEPSWDAFQQAVGES